MDVSSLSSSPGARKGRRRVGRGVGSGHGKTAGRGQKGQRARTGSGKRPGFEGGQTPLIRRLPKRGFRRKAPERPRKPVILNVGQLERCPAGERITPERLEALGLIRSGTRRVKLLGDGAVGKPITIVVHRASAAARAKVEQAGGKVELLEGSGGTAARTRQGGRAGVQRQDRDEASGHDQPGT